VYNKSLDEHALHLKEVFTVLRENKFHVKVSKCEFAK
jgi:hypothetical protein